MASMPSPAGWAAFVVVIGLIGSAWGLLARALSSPSPPYGQGGYGHGSEADRRRRTQEATEGRKRGSN
jgi:hypothetical protein